MTGMGRKRSLAKRGQRTSLSLDGVCSDCSLSLLAFPLQVLDDLEQLHPPPAVVIVRNFAIFGGAFHAESVVVFDPDRGQDRVGGFWFSALGWFAHCGERWVPQKSLVRAMKIAINSLHGARKFPAPKLQFLHSFWL